MVLAAANLSGLRLPAPIVEYTSAQSNSPARSRAQAPEATLRERTALGLAIVPPTPFAPTPPSPRTLPLPIGHVSVSVSDSDKARRFTLGDKIGHGDFGVVYHARDTETGAHLAVKHILVFRGSTWHTMHLVVTLEDAKRECDIALSLHHPNIVRSIDAYNANGSQYLVMEYAEGGTLADWIGRAPSSELTTACAVDIVQQLIGGLLYMAEQGIVTWDFRPANVFFADVAHTHALIGDFGHADHCTRGRYLNPWLTDPDWQEPEHEWQNVNPEESYVYRLGRMLDAMLTRCPDAPAPLRTLCERMASFEPSHRPKLVDLSELLRKAQAG